ncbi:MAG: metalloregulator ArsR/SmtB family transcription factor [Pseudomonadota bacterium]
MGESKSDQAAVAIATGAGEAEGSAASAALEARAVSVAAKLALLGNPRRLMILCRLSEGECSVSGLQTAVGISQSALSQHLARLREAGVVATRREGQTILYRLDNPDTEALMAALYDVFCAGPSGSRAD